MDKLTKVLVAFLGLIAISCFFASYNEKKADGPIGTNPVSYFFTDATIESLKVNYLGVGTSADSIVVHNNTTKQLNRIAAPKKATPYSGTTNASGVYTVTFPTAYAVAPNIQANMVNQSATNQFLRISSITTTGFTVNTFARASLTVLGLELLAAATVVVPSAPVDVLITEK